MKSKCKKSFPWFVLGLLGFATACQKTHEEPVMYGPPPAMDTRVSGTVTDSDGKPVAGIQVQSYGKEVLTSSDGHYQIAGESWLSIPITFTDIDGAENGGEFVEQRLQARFDETDRQDDGSYTLEGVDVQMQEKQ